MTMTQEELNEIVRLHNLWLTGANLSRANLSYADLSYADLSRANLSYANLSYADLSYADLSRANMRDADLSYADLSRANMRDADLSYANMRGAANIVSIIGIGSSRRMTTYREDTDEVWCGCFHGTLAEFASKNAETHKENADHLAHYRAAVEFFKSYKASVRPVEKKAQTGAKEV